MKAEWNCGVGKIQWSGDRDGFDEVLGVKFQFGVEESKIM